MLQVSFTHILYVSVTNVTSANKFLLLLVCMSAENVFLEVQIQNKSYIYLFQ